MADFTRYHALGNDYVVMEPARFTGAPSPPAVRRICDRHLGLGSDGILWGPLDTAAAVPGLRIYNPDGSEAEKSGNGLRIFARHLWQTGRVRERSFAIDTAGGRVRARILDAGEVAVEMGRVTLGAAEQIDVGARRLTIHPVSIGNPHCVVPLAAPTPALACELGPLLEHHPRFPARTNVQLLAAVDAHAIRIEIWERGAGYTLASGSSSCAAAAVAHALGLARSPIAVHMPGGVLTVELDAALDATLTGPVAAVAIGDLADEFLAALGMARR